MKYALSLVSLILFCTIATHAQSNECSIYHDGKFKIVDANSGGTTIIERNGDYQTETQEQAGISIRFKVTWLSNCSYTLKVDKILQNDKKSQLPTDMILMVKITEVLKDGYIQESRFPGIEAVYTSKVTALK